MPAARLTEGVNVAEVDVVPPLPLTVPATAALFDVLTSLKLAVLSVEFFIASEKTTDIVEVSATPLAPLTGEVASTFGGVVSGTEAVVNLQVKLAASALPAASFAAVVMVAVYWVEPARLAEGVNLAVFPLTLTVPPTVAPPAVGLKV